jgi:cation diffusion facilitator family transporter
MHNQTIAPWKHDHTFGQEEVKAGEKRTIIVAIITATMMIVEIITGILFGSMALLADGIHMGSHAVALGISVVAYIYARRYAGDRRFSFGTGKVNALAGYTSAIILAIFALSMVWESIERFFNPVEIIFNQAILVAIIGLIVNVVSVLILGDRHSHSHSHQGKNEQQSHQHADHNLRAAYLHVLADALTSVLAIFALLSGKYLGLIWMDPLMGIIGAVMVIRWSLGLWRETSSLLLDQQASEEVQREIITAIETQGSDRVSDLHIWSIGPNIFSATISIVTDDPKSSQEYKENLPQKIGLVHSTIEVLKCEAS